jgi:hypothetical protein
VVSLHHTETSGAENEPSEGAWLPGFIAGTLWTIADTSSYILEFVMPSFSTRLAELKYVHRATGLP